MAEKIVATGAESQIISQGGFIIKRRIPKSYRIKELDVKLRKLRTRSEGKIIKKLQGRVNVPRIIKVDEKTNEIEMENIKGEKLSDFLDIFSLKKQKKIIQQLAEEVVKIHNLNIIHGDLTTSNMILVDKFKIYIIDFGLGFHSSKIEDKAVDIHLFKQALESRHFKNWGVLFQEFIKYYNPQDKQKILTQLEKVESRGRYKH